MKIKGVILAIAIIVLTIFVTYYGINIFFPGANYDDYCGINAGAKACPAVCISMYEINSGNCTFVECGSGCGSDGINSFSTLELCKEGLKLSDQKRCEIQNGTWTSQKIECIKAPCPQGYCDLYSKCNQEFTDADRERSRNVFFIALPLGVLIIALGAFFFGLEVVGAGLMGGGIGTLIYGSGAYWPYTENWIRFALSLAGLIIVIWLAYYFNRKLGKGFGKKKR
ncbi:MAG: hypothetical protein AABY15_08305 [Nanoarchaeota archaeon]